MKKTVLILMFALGALPAAASPGNRCALSDAGDGSRTVLARISPTNPNDPLFPPGQWPSCMGQRWQL